MIGANNSVPRSDQVPELRNAVVPDAATAANAEPVSWHAGRTIGVPARATLASFRSGPRIVPGSASSGSSRAGMSSASRRSVAHRRVDALMYCVVVALVNSARKLAGEPVVQHIRDHRNSMRRRDDARCRSTRRIQLVQRVEPQKLNPGRAVDALAGNLGEHLFHDAVGARVPVGERGLDEAAVLAEETIVAAPRVDADALESLGAGPLQRGLHLPPHAVDVPSQRAVVADRSIREAAHFGERERAAVQRSADRPAALGSDIKREKLFHTWPTH